MNSTNITNSENNRIFDRGNATDFANLTDTSDFILDNIPDFLH